jgi:DNA polymerase III sliding clamp (beta) subunit (PCNA family)
MKNLELQKAITEMKCFVNKYSPSKLLESIMLSIRDKKLSLRYTDLDIYVDLDLNQKTEIETDYLFSLPKDIIKILQALNDDIEIIVKGGGLYFNNFGINSLSQFDDYPFVPEFKNEIKITNLYIDKTLSNLIKNMLPITSTDATKWVYQSLMMFLENNNISFVTTDGKRLSYVQTKTAGKWDNILTQKSWCSLMQKSTIFINKLVANFMTRREGIYEISLNQIIGEDKKTKLHNWAKIKYNNITVIYKYEEYVAPDIFQVIPKSEEYKIKTKINAKQFVDNIKNLYYPKDWNFIDFKFSKNKLTIQSQNTEIKKDLVIDNDTNMKIRYNKKFVINNLNIFSKNNIELMLVSDETPMVFKSIMKTLDNSFDITMLLMPVRD